MNHLTIIISLWFLFISIAHSWSFTDEDYQKLSKSQKYNLDIIYMVWETKGYGLRGVSKAIVENMAKNTDNNPNHICGPLQVDVNITKTECKAHESNIYYNATIGLQEFIDWKSQDVYQDNKYIVTVERSDDLATMMYNSGYEKNKFRYIHLSKVHKAEKVLKKYYK